MIDDVLRTEDGQLYRWPPAPAEDYKTYERVTHIIGNGIPKFGLTAWSAIEAAKCAIENIDDVVAHIAGKRHINQAWWDQTLEDAAKKDYWKKKNGGRAYYVPKFEKMSWDDQLILYIREASDRSRDASADIGSAVHDLADRLSQGEVVDVPDELDAHVTNYLDFLQTIQPEILLTEMTFYSDTHRYAGRGDLICRINGELCLVDLKTGKKGVYDSVAPQLAAYAGADFIGYPDGEHEEVPDFDAYYAVSCNAEGWELIPVAVDGTVFSKFLAADSVADWVGNVSKSVLGFPVAGNTKRMNKAKAS